MGQIAMPPLPDEDRAYEDRLQRELDREQEEQLRSLERQDAVFFLVILGLAAAALGLALYATI